MSPPCPRSGPVGDGGATPTAPNWPAAIVAEDVSAAPAAAGRFALLDPLRGLAALWVVTFHYDTFAEASPVAHRVTRSGYLGVSLFFVISGYCLAAAAARARARKESAASFLARRLWRIYPPLWCSVILVAAGPYLIAAASGAASGRWQSPTPLAEGYTAADWVAVGTLAQAFRDPGRPIHEKFERVNVVYWSLAVEVQFYLVMAVAVAAGCRGRWLLAAVTVASLPFVVVPTLFAAINSGWFLPYWPAFAIGVGTYAARARGLSLERCRPWAGPAAAALFAAAAGTAAGCLVAGVRLPPLGFPGLAAVALWAGMRWERAGRAAWESGRVGRGLAAPLLALGTVSYSLYLVHPVLGGTIHAALDGLSAGRVAAVPAVTDVAAVAAAVLMCVPFYYFCERPFTSRPPWHRRRNGGAVTDEARPGPASSTRDSPLPETPRPPPPSSRF